MKLQNAVDYLKEKAYNSGYTPKQFTCFEWEVKEKIYLLEECSVEELDKLFEEIF